MLCAVSAPRTAFVTGNGGLHERLGRPLSLLINCWCETPCGQPSGMIALSACCCCLCLRLLTLATDGKLRKGRQALDARAEVKVSLKYHPPPLRRWRHVVQEGDELLSRIREQQLLDGELDEQIKSRIRVYCKKPLNGSIPNGTIPNGSLNGSLNGSIAGSMGSRSVTPRRNRRLLGLREREKLTQAYILRDYPQSRSQTPIQQTARPQIPRSQPSSRASTPNAQRPRSQTPTPILRSPKSQIPKYPESQIPNSEFQAVPVPVLSKKHTRSQSPGYFEQYFAKKPKTPATEGIARDGHNSSVERSVEQSVERRVPSSPVVGGWQKIEKSGGAFGWAK